jgi:outer membrane protein
MKAGFVLAGNIALAAAAWAQAPSVQTPSVSLAQAQQTALQNHPRIASAAYQAQASGFAVREARSAYYPSLSGSITGVGTDHGSVLSAGALTTSSLFSRGATGIVANQLVTDFGRTGSLVQSARLRNESRNANVINTRAEVLIEVQMAYYQALAPRQSKR